MCDYTNLIYTLRFIFRPFVYLGCTTQCAKVRTAIA